METTRSESEIALEQLPCLKVPICLKTEETKTFQSNHIQGLTHIIKCRVKAKTGREKIKACGPLLPTVRSETVCGEAGGNTSNSS